MPAGDYTEITGNNQADRQVSIRPGKQYPLFGWVTC